MHRGVQFLTTLFGFYQSVLTTTMNNISIFEHKQTET